MKVNVTKFRLLTLTLCMVLFCVSAVYAQFAGGSGTEADPYQVATAEHLNNVRGFLGAFFIQTADINLGIPPYNQDNGWQPIHTFIAINDSANVPFSGKYDGDGHNISNLYMYRVAFPCVGLFGEVDGGEICNLNLITAYIIGASLVGGIAGYTDEATISNCSVSGLVLGSGNIGGLVGSTYVSDISNCTVSCTVEGSNSVGGLTGSSDRGTNISGCTVTGSVTGSDYTGGIAGANFSIISGCNVTGNVSGANNVGGITGESFDNYEVSLYYINDCHVSGNVSGNDNVGGLSGSTANGFPIRNSSFTGNLTGENFVNGLVGYPDGTLYNSFYNYETVSINNMHLVTAGALGAELFTDWFANGGELEAGEYLTFSEGSYQIANINDFKCLLAFGQEDSLSFKLTGNIDLINDVGFYIPYFAGRLDGNGFSISNPCLGYNFMSYIGLFGQLNQAALANLTVINANVTGAFCVGGLAGRSDDSEIENCSLMGSVTGNDIAGGLVGMNNATSITDCQTQITLTGAGRSGGLTGYVTNSTLDNCQVTGTVLGSSRLGGLAGTIAESHLNDCRTDVIVSGNECVGGLVGYGEHNTLTRCSAEGSVAGYTRIGGLVGMGSQANEVSNSWASGNVISTGYDIGGLVGFQDFGNINLCYATGNVSGSSCVGGLVGNLQYGSVANCFATGNVSGSGAAGLVSATYNVGISNSYAMGEVNGIGSNGLAGMDYMSTVTHSYWDVETSGVPAGALNYGRTTDEMTFPYSGNTYTNWNFNSIWANDPDGVINNGYPYLRNMPVTANEDEIHTSIPFLSMGNYPNPFTSSTNISFSLPKSSYSTVTIFNLKGQKVRTLANRYLSKGEHCIQWNGRDEDGKSASEGIYLYRLKGKGFQITRKMTLIKN